MGEKSATPRQMRCVRPKAPVRKSECYKEDCKPSRTREGRIRLVGLDGDSPVGVRLPESSAPGGLGAARDSQLYTSLRIGDARELVFG